MLSILFGDIPKPQDTPPILVLENVTYGYVPKSISSIKEVVPSTKILVLMKLTLSTTYGFKWAMYCILRVYLRHCIQIHQNVSFC
jgi:hypothetical protein